MGRRPRPVDPTVITAADGQVIHRWSQAAEVLRASGSQRTLAQEAGYCYATAYRCSFQGRVPNFHAAIDLLGAAGFELVLRRKR